MACVVMMLSWLGNKGVGVGVGICQPSYVMNVKGKRKTGEACTTHRPTLRSKGSGSSREKSSGFTAT